MLDEILFRSIPGDRILIFSKIFCLAVLFKNSLELYRGYWHYLDEGNYLFFLNRSGKKLDDIWVGIYKLTFIFKFIFPIFVIFSFLPSISFIFMAFSFWIEMKNYFKYHANLMFLYSMILSLFYFSLSDSGTTIILFPLAITLTLSSVYVFTAIHKMNRSFLSGNVILRTLDLLKESKRNFFDFWTIKGFGSILKYEKYITLLMYATVTIELLLPLLLYSEKFKLIGCFLGICMHIGFTLLFPATLLHFSLISISTYLLFFYF